MFIKYSFLGWLGEGLYRYPFKFSIIDTDFTHTDLQHDGNWYDAVIDTYANRNLNVATNLALAIKLNGNDTSRILALCRLISINFHKYEREVNKYLMLM